MKNTLKSVLAILSIALTLAACTPKAENTETEGQDSVQVEEAPAPVIEQDTTASETADSAAVSQ